MDREDILQQLVFKVSQLRISTDARNGLQIERTERNNKPICR